MTSRTRQASVRHARPMLPSLRALTCLLAFAGAGIGLHSEAAKAGTVPAIAPAPVSASPDAAHPVTAWAASVHAALARQAAARQARHVPLAPRQAFTQSGVASWYGHDFAGRRTSSGVRFDPMQLTCAHRTLPLGTRLLVTSHQTGRSVVVTVNDRGPYAGPERIIDLSRAAASRLGMVQDGLNTVTLKRVAPSTVEVAQAADSDDNDQAVAAAADSDASSGRNMAGRAARR